MAKGSKEEDRRAEAWTGSKVRTRDGAKLGKLEHVYRAQGTDEPTWGVVRSGLLRRKRHFVPLGGASASDGELSVAAERDQVSSAPAVPADRELEPDTESRLADHYSTGATAAGAGAGSGAHEEGRAGSGTATGAGAEGRDRDRDDAAEGRRDREREDAEGSRGRGSALAMPRSRGAASGTLLVVLGIWGAVIPLVGPYFNYGFAPDQPWLFTLDRLFLSFLPGIAVVVGGLLLGPSANRATAGIGAWLALAGGVWFVIGPTMSALWGGGGPVQPIGSPLGPTGLAVLELLGYFYALGALVITLAALAMGRMAVRSVKDPR